MEFITRVYVMAAASFWLLLSIGIVIHCRHRPACKTGMSIFCLEELYPAGDFVRGKLRRKDRKRNDRIRKLLELKSPVEAEQVGANAAAAPYTYLMMLGPIALMLFAVSASASLLLVEILLIGFMCCAFDLWLNSELDRRHTELERQLPSMLTELSLMVNVGIPATTAFARVAEASNGLLYREMQRTVSQQMNGMPADQALQELTTRCPLRGIRKFVSLYRQNLVKGGPDFAIVLEEMAANAWVQRKNSARTQGELAEQKLLIPTLFMFLGILLIVIVPAFQNIL